MPTHVMQMHCRNFQVHRSTIIERALVIRGGWHKVHLLSSSASMHYEVHQYHYSSLISNHLVCDRRLNRRAPCFKYMRNNRNRNWALNGFVG